MPLLGLLVGCTVTTTTHRVTVTGEELQRNLPLLRHDGHAKVRVHVDDDPSSRTESVRLKQTVVFDGGRYTIKELAHGCPSSDAQVSGTPEAPCLLKIFAKDPLELRRFKTRTSVFTGTFAKAAGVAGLAALAVSAGCAVNCEDHSTAKTVSQATMVVLGLAAIGTVTFAIYCLAAHPRRRSSYCGPTPF